MRPVLPEIRRPRKCLPTSPENYEHVAATLDDIRRTHKPFSTRHRIIRIQGETREVVVIGERLHDNAGEVIGTQGFYIYVTPTDEARQAAISEAVAEISDRHAVIEQVTGILIFVYHIDDNAAFDLLRWRSQETNTKLRSLAEQLMDDIRELASYEDPPLRSTFDRLLLTAHVQPSPHTCDPQTERAALGLSPELHTPRHQVPERMSGQGQVFDTKIRSTDRQVSVT